MTTRFLALVMALLMLSEPAVAQQLASPKTITTSSASCTSANCVEIDMRGVQSAGINVEGEGTYTLEIEASKNNGVTWYAFNAVDEADPDALIQEITAPGNFSVVGSGITRLRIRASALSVGTPVVSTARGFLGPLTAIATGGGGGGGTATEYTEGATDASITGVAMLMEGAANTLLPIQGTVADGLLVNLGANNDVVESNSAAILAAVDGLEALVTSTNGYVDGIETLLGTANTSLQLIDDPVIVDDAAFTPSTSSVAMSGFQFDDVTPDSVNEGDAGAARMSANRNIYTTIRDAAGNERGVNINSSNELLTSSNTELPAAATLADDTANPSLPAVAAYLMAFDGSTWDRARLASDMTVGSAFGTSGPGLLASYKDFDGSALPITTNVGTEEEAVPLAASQYGVVYNLPTTENGSATPLLVDESAYTYASGALLAIGAIAESTTDAAADGAVVVPVTTLNRVLRNTPTGYLGGGGVPVNMLSDASDNEDETAICTGPCTVYSIAAFNHTAASAFLRCENDTAANTTPGSETASDGEFNLEIPASTTGAGFIYNPGAGIGASFSTALTCWIVSDEASSGTTDVAADDVRVQFVRVQ